MTKYEFKNGITVIIPSHLSKAEVNEAWADVGWKMSIVLNPPEPEPKKTRKPYTFSETTRKKILAAKGRRQKRKAKLKS